CRARSACVSRRASKKSIPAIPAPSDRRAAPNTVNKSRPARWPVSCAYATLRHGGISDCPPRTRGEHARPVLVSGQRDSVRAVAPMSTLLRLLLVEDSADDAALVTRQLKRGGYQPICTRVQTQGEFRSAVASKEWDIIISDYTLPTYSGLMALADLRATGKDIPFILVSGTVGDAEAVRAMKA